MEVQPKKGSSNSGVVSNGCPDIVPNNHLQARARPVVKSVIELAISHRVHLNKGKEKQEHIERNFGEAEVCFVSHA